MTRLCVDYENFAIEWAFFVFRQFWKDERRDLLLRELRAGIDCARKIVGDDQQLRHGFYRLYTGTGPRRCCQTSSQRARVSGERGPSSHAARFCSNWSSREAPRITDCTEV